ILLAEGEKQSAILKAEGDQQAQILQAEGQKQAQIALAEGDRQGKVLRAQGDAESIRLVKQAEADMITKTFGAIKDANPDTGVLQIKYLEALQKVADGKSTTLVVPYESAAMMGALSGAVTALKKSQDSN